MQRKTGIIGLLILLVVAAAAGYLMLNGGTPQEPTALRGYVGGEKIGLLEDGAVREVLAKDYGIALDYAKAGSLDMVTADHEGRDFLFPSSQTALEYYQQLYGAPAKSQIVFNSLQRVYHGVHGVFRHCTRQFPSGGGAPGTLQSAVRPCGRHEVYQYCGCGRRL